MKRITILVEQAIKGMSAFMLGHELNKDSNLYFYHVEGDDIFDDIGV